jgi:fimbrial chaperone protein
VTSFPALSGKDLIAALRRGGFQTIRVRGSHHFVRHADGRSTVVPVHAGETIGTGRREIVRPHRALLCGPSASPLGLIFVGATMASPLKLAFQQSRAQRNIDLVLPALKTTTLYVIVGSEPKQGQRPEWFLTESPTKGRFCVTTSETEAALARVPRPKLKISGAQLLEALPPGIEVTIVYPDGGDYITREQLDWYRQAK